jgi:hypothetical protein
MVGVYGNLQLVQILFIFGMTSANPSTNWVISKDSCGNPGHYLCRK